MKKSFIVLLSILSLNLFSQEKSLSIGVKSGGGISFLYFNQNSTKINPNISPVFSAGISLAYSEEGMFYLQSDLMYERKSVTQKRNYNNYTYGSTNSKGRAIGSADYISLSALPGLKTKGKLKFLLFGGPSVEFLVNAQTAEVVIANSGKRKQITYYNQNWKFEDRLAFGLVLGTGMQAALSDKVNLQIALRNNLTLFKPNYALSNFNTTNIMIGIYYSLNKKK